METWFGTTSTFTETDDLAKRALLWKVNGLNPWWSRELSTTSTMFGIPALQRLAQEPSRHLTRLSDDTIMARFILPNKFIWGVLGMLQVLEPVPEYLLELIFCAMYVKYLRDEVPNSFP
ncbi:hypothetical protein FS837_002162 [Tulasnella sp. UAMH 9824]|nr:hypothetical protein FS837_002162 [Tulasnella sp. UAMH 9824]